MKLFLAFFFLVVPCASRANDSLVSVDSGNLTLKKSSEISMESEELTISQDKVSVKYLFRNLSNKKIEEIVAFPSAPIHRASVHDKIVIDSDNPMKFVLRENGKEKIAKFTRTVFLEDPNEPESEVITLNYFWNQMFPAKGQIELSHEYRPLLGTGGQSQPDKNLQDYYCMDKDFLSGLEKLKARIRNKLSATNESYKLEDYLSFNSFRSLSYILRTANNWSGPIKNFKLRVVKDRPSTLVSFCWDGLKKISETEFESTKTNFRPKSDLKILFVMEN